MSWRIWRRVVFRLVRAQRAQLSTGKRRGRPGALPCRVHEADKIGRAERFPSAGSASVESDDTGTGRPSRIPEGPLHGLLTGRPLDRFT